MGTNENEIQPSSKVKISQWHWAILVLGLALIAGSVIGAVIT